MKLHEMTYTEGARKASYRVAVSYTHLDVYKRQVLHLARVRF